MKDSYVLKCVRSDSALEFRGVIPRGLEGYDGTTYAAALVGHRISAVVDVYDIQPQRWSAFFRDLADNWKGWAGAKAHESLEGHLAVSCTSDRLGHVAMHVHLRGDMGDGDWKADVTLYLEAGNLASIAQAAEEYFG